MKTGAVDFIEKPFDDQLLLDRITQAISLDSEHRRERARLSEYERRFERLTPREGEVMELLVEGMTSREIGERLGISRKTVDIHRARVMQKLQADSVAHLVRMVMARREATGT
jgi:RNA polymerase sigma factor (sigma-70 family)